ncbi:MAG TPA: response regulator transcription factor [Bryobacteraceae bacterium]|jgi:DNA-binding response OmpR family regulator|nr:response regulator transcription factor [Bryobacteraceae bacterium]
MRVLVMEDERRMAALLKRGLTEEGHQVFVAYDGVEGFEMARSAEFDILVLDVMLPGVDGLTIARRLREENNQTPILMLTARDTAANVIAGLDAGADDYITKPFSFEIFLARVRAVSRRGAIPRAVCLEVADLKLNPSTRQVTRGRQAISLTPREFSLLELLMRNHGRVISRDTILESVWGFDSDVAGNTIEAFVRLLRLKIDSGEPKLIHTVRGVGYVMRTP